jgi:amino acid transporter
VGSLSCLSTSIVESDGFHQVTFAVNEPIGIAAVLGSLRSLPANPLHDAPYDFLSALMNACVFGLLITAVDGLGHGEGHAYVAAEQATPVDIKNVAKNLFILVTWFAEQAFTLALKMTSAMTLVPYLLVAAYGLKLAWTGETYDTDARGRTADWACGAIATVYAAGMLYAGGAKFLLLSALLYAPGTWLYAQARREQGQRVFTFAETLIFGALCLAAAAALYALMSGAIAI